MTENPFFNANFMALGGQMAQVWQRSLETWWEGLLGDRERLADLARVLSESGFGANGPSGASSEDMTRVVEALELIERRQEALEKQVRSLTENLGAVVTFLETLQGEGASVPEGADEP